MNKKKYLPNLSEVILYTFFYYFLDYAYYFISMLVINVEIQKILILVQ